MKALTFVGSTVFLGGLIILTLLALIWRRNWRSTRLVFFAGLFTPIVIEVLKMVFHRARPELWNRPPDTSYSFPSGHALGSAAGPPVHCCSLRSSTGTRGVIGCPRSSGLG